MAIIVSTDSALILNNRASISRTGLNSEISGESVIIKSNCGSVRWTLNYKTDTIDGDSYDTAQDLFDVVSAFNNGGGAPAEGVLGITGDLVDNTDPKNPIINSLAAPTWGEVTGKPTTFAPIIGTTATTAKAGNYQPTWAQVTAKPVVIAFGATALEARNAIGAGSSSLQIGTTAQTAMAGNKAATYVERGGVLLQTNITDITEAPTMEDYNALLAVLRSSGILG